MHFFKIVFLILLAGCSHLFYQGSPHQYVDPARFNLKFQDVYFPSKDGTPLHGWFFPTSAKKALGTIIHFHGNAQNISTHFMNLAWLPERGYNYFIFDYRGYWKSKGKPNQKNVNEDALAALRKGLELNQSHGGGLYVVYGQSLGAVISMRALSEFDTSQVDLLVQDSGFSNYSEMAFDRLTIRWFLMPLAPLAYVLVSNEYGTKEVLPKMKVPTLVIVSKKDDVVPAKFGKYIFKHVGAKTKWLWVAESAPHIAIFQTEEGKYRKAFLDLLAGLCIKP